PHHFSSPTPRHPIHSHPLPTRRSSDLAGKSSASSIRLRHRWRRAISNPSGLEHPQATLWTNHCVRHEQRHDRVADRERRHAGERDRKSTRLNSSQEWISYAVFCLKEKI